MWRPTRILFILLLAALSDPSTARWIHASENATLMPIPWPEDSAMETAIQEQLRTVRSVLEPMITDSGASRQELADAYGTAGEVFLVYSLIDSAVASLYNAATLAPDEFRWNYFLGRTYQEDGRPEKGSAYLAKAHELRPEDLPSLIRLAQAELAQEHLEAATSRFREVLEFEPDNAAAHYGLGQIAYQRQDYPQAVQQFEAALAAQPGAHAIHYQLALAYRDLGDTDKGRSHMAQRGPHQVEFEEPLMQSLRTLVRGGSLLVYSATHARAAGDLAAAAQGFRQALEIDPSNNAARLNLASTLIQQGDLAEAGRVLAEALEYDEDNSSAHYNLGLVLEQTGQTELALHHLQLATELAPDFVDAHLNYGLLLQEAGRPAEAQEQYSLATQLDPTDAEARFRHASVLLQLNRTAEAIGELRLALDVQPDSVDGHLLLARAQGVDGQFSAAAESFARVLALEPDNAEALFARALALLLSEQYTAAENHLERGLRHQPGNLALKHFLARLLATCPDESVRDGDRALLLAQEVVRADLTIDHAETVAMALAETGRFGEAEALQLQILDEASRSGAGALMDRLQGNLAMYRGQQPVRAPWRQGN